MGECIVGGVAPKNVYTIDGTSYSRILNVNVGVNGVQDNSYSFHTSYTLNSGRIVRIEIPAGTLYATTSNTGTISYSMPYHLFKESGKTSFASECKITCDFQAGTVKIFISHNYVFQINPVYVNIFVLDI